MKKKRIKAQTVMGWNIGHPKLDGPTIHYVLPADAASYERMVEQMDVVIEKAINRWLAGYGGQDDLPRAALRAVGITAPKRGKKGSK